jgi:hypothetical protein
MFHLLSARAAQAFRLMEPGITFVDAMFDHGYRIAKLYYTNPVYESCKMDL